MFWISWVLCAIVFAVLFSIVKTVDRLCYSVELVDARLDRLTKSVESLTSLINAASAPAQIDRGDTPRRDWLS